jgi:hypothetical protein
MQVKLVRKSDGLRFPRPSHLRPSAGASCPCFNCLEKKDLQTFLHFGFGRLTNPYTRKKHLVNHLLWLTNSYAKSTNLVNRVGSLVGFILWKGYSFISLQGKTPHREGFPSGMPLYLPVGDGI